jgi:hypothetical protein
MTILPVVDGNKPSNDSERRRRTRCVPTRHRKRTPDPNERSSESNPGGVTQTDTSRGSRSNHTRRPPRTGEVELNDRPPVRQELAIDPLVNPPN